MRMNTDALVLKVTDTGESDRLVTLLTAEFGVLREFANRAKKINSKIHGATQSLCYGDFSIYSSRESYIIDDAIAKEVKAMGENAKVAVRNQPNIRTKMDVSRIL